MWTNLINRMGLRNEEGQTTVEYALVIVLVALVIAGVLAAGISSGVFDAFWSTVTEALGGS
jgi:Flp pilus assembly pilin Flp